MKTRILKTHLSKRLEALLEDHPKSVLAAKIGVSPQKLGAMMSDEWEYITRDALERTADFLKLEVEDVFEFVPVKFWEPIEQAKNCIFLRGSEADVTKAQQYEIPRYDDEATQTIKKFLRDSLPDLGELPIAEHRRNEETEIMKKATTQNCIVIGSPKTNAATEIILSRFFGAEPFNSTVENRRKIPFGFCWPEGSSIVESSSLTCSEAARKEVQDRPGIATVEGIHVPADYRPLTEFHALKITKGLDCGLVFVANQPFGTKDDVKLIVLAGFAGIGTLAAAKALVQDFRYIEPVGDEKCVYGIVEGKYRKAAKTTAREFKGYRWRFRNGGHAPMGQPNIQTQ